MKKFFLFALAAILFTAFTDDKKPKSATLKGPEVKVHGGKGWTWVKYDKNGNPEKIGMSLSEDALNTVPQGGSADHGHTPDNHWIVKFHPSAKIPFNHVGMHWNPAGHEPETIYTVPHFDFHFYISTPEEVEEIGTYEKDSVRFKNYPSTDYFPANYFNPGAPSAVPQMGSHWMDTKSGEFNGKPFTETFIFGSFDGKVTFQEPMITLDFLKKNTNYVRDLPQPAKVQASGYYPTRMRVIKENGVTSVVLEGLVYRKQA